MLSTSVSLPDVGGSRRAPKSLMSSSGVERFRLFVALLSDARGTEGGGSILYPRCLELEQPWRARRQWQPPAGGRGELASAMLVGVELSAHKKRR